MDVMKLAVAALVGGAITLVLVLATRTTAPQLPGVSTGTPRRAGAQNRAIGISDPATQPSEPDRASAVAAVEEEADRQESDVSASGSTAFLLPELEVHAYMLPVRFDHFESAQGAQKVMAAQDLLASSIVVILGAKGGGPVPLDSPHHGHVSLGGGWVAFYSNGRTFRFPEQEFPEYAELARLISQGVDDAPNPQGARMGLQYYHSGFDPALIARIRDRALEALKYLNDEPSPTRSGSKKGK